MAEAQPFLGWLDDLRSSDKERQNRAYTGLIEASDTPVDWAYEAWDELVRLLAEGDNRQRSIASQVLANLAKSDPERRILHDLPALLRVTEDERFVTARHCLQSLWKIGSAGEDQRRALVEGLSARFVQCAAEKNGTLIRYDILVALRRVYDGAGEASIRELAERLVALETDPKYRKKYASVWRESR